MAHRLSRSSRPVAERRTPGRSHVEPLATDDRQPIRSTTPATILIALGLATFAIVIYLANKQTLASYDSAPNSLLVLDALHYHRLDFDAFRASYFVALGGAYAFVEGANGHLTSVFPIGTAILSAPFYAVLFAVHAAQHAPAITTAAFEPMRQHDEKLVAALLGGLSVALFFLTAREFTTAAPAMIATAVYGFATPMWSIASQALWQHGPVNLVLLAAVYSLLRARRAHTVRAQMIWLTAAGACSGFLPVVRPTAALFTVALLVFTVWTQRRASWPFACGLVLGIAPGLGWNAYFFHSIVGGYTADNRDYQSNLLQALTAFAALLVSPSRGLFVFSPVLGFAAYGAVRLARTSRTSDPVARLLLLLACACVALVVQYAFYQFWWAGFAYGPRFLTDTVSVAGLVLAYVMPKHPLLFWRRTAGSVALTVSFVLCLACSVAVQVVGTNSGAAGSDWNAVPISVDRDPSRVWRVTDSQIERNARALFSRLFPPSIAGNGSAGSDLRIVIRQIALADERPAAGSTLKATVTLRNEGRSRAFGYPSGVYLGQLRVRVRIIDPRNHRITEQMLYVTSSVASGDEGVAIGEIAMPHRAGSYLIECDPVLVGGAHIARSSALRVPLSLVS